jgi:hypothetical protein
MELLPVGVKDGDVIGTLSRVVFRERLWTGKRMGIFTAFPVNS